jgi:hypothetical protein
MLMDLTCDPGTMSSDGLNACIALNMAHDTDAGLDIVLNNPVAETSAGGGVRFPIPQIFRVRSTSASLGAYGTLFSIGIAPQLALFHIGCQAGDRSGDCSKSGPYDLFHLAGANGGSHLTWSPRDDVLTLQGGTLSLRSVQLTSATLPCTSAQKGQFNYIEGKPGVKDTVQVCAKDAADNWAWRTLY